MDWERSGSVPAKGFPNTGSMGDGEPCVSAMSTAPWTTPRLAGDGSRVAGDGWRVTGERALTLTLSQRERGRWVGRRGRGARRSGQEAGLPRHWRGVGELVRRWPVVRLWVRIADLGTPGRTDLKQTANEP